MSIELFKTQVNRIVFVIFLLFLALAIRCFQLAIVDYDTYLNQSIKPKRKVVIEPAERGLIIDRSGLVLATNSPTYQAGICYDEIRHLPKNIYKWENGRLKKHPYRLEYVKKLSEFLSEFFQTPSIDIEDFIFGKAALFPNQFFCLKDQIPYPLYIQLKALKKDWPGLQLQTQLHRLYPEKKLGSHLLGYMGMIHQKEYEAVQDELHFLKKILDDFAKGMPAPLPIGYKSFYEVRSRYELLREKAYQYSSKVGKAGIEGRFDESLRGLFGKKKLEIDLLGREKRILPDSIEPKGGNTLRLSIDAKLQLKAETLLTEHEEKRDKNFRISGKNHQLVQSPWIKGGAIIAMNPKNGQIYALASYPRFDPNDFSSADQKSIIKWLELPSYFPKIWEGELLLEKERYDPKSENFYTEKKRLSYDFFLDAVLSTHSKVKKQIHLLSSIEHTLDLFKIVASIEQFMENSPAFLWINWLYPDSSPVKPLKNSIDPISYNYYLDLFHANRADLETLKASLDLFLKPIPSNQDKLLYLDLIRLALPVENPHLAHFSNWKLHDFFMLNQEILETKKTLKKAMKSWFHPLSFHKWRQEEFKNFLKDKRKEEKLNKKHQRPYIEYLEEEEKKQFEAFYSEYQDHFLSAVLFKTPLNPAFSHYSPSVEQFRNTLFENPDSRSLATFSKTFYEHPLKLEIFPLFRSFDSLTSPLYGVYPKRNGKSTQKLNDLAFFFYPQTGYGFSRSYAFQESAPQGSIFKIITAYEGLKQAFLNQKNESDSLNPLTLIDNSDGKITNDETQVLGFHQDGRKITRYYKGGKLPRSSKRCGKISLIEALEMSSNLYFSILAADLIKSPLDLTKTAKTFGFGQKTGIDLPYEVSGVVPYDILSNKTALYALSIGQHSLTVSPLQSAKMLSAIVNGGLLLKPEIIHSKIKQIETSQKNQSRFEPYYKKIGLKTPLFEEPGNSILEETTTFQQRTVIQKIFYPLAIQKPIQEGLRKVVNGEKGTARPETIRFQKQKEKENYLKNKNRLIGKTASAEIVYHPFLDHEIAPILCKHIWFACCGYDENSPELVIIVYLRYGDYGKEAALIASELYEKYLEIKQQESGSSSLTSKQTPTIKQ